MGAVLSVDFGSIASDDARDEPTCLASSSRFPGVTLDSIRGGTAARGKSCEVIPGRCCFSSEISKVSDALTTTSAAIDSGTRHRATKEEPLTCGLALTARRAAARIASSNVAGGCSVDVARQVREMSLSPASSASRSLSSRD